jgi:hypothetical protein
MHKHAQLIEQYLHYLYQDTQGYRKKEKKRHRKDLSDAYGEILYPSIDKLLTLFPLSPEDIFLDLGSGLGKLIAQVFLNTPIKEARGIELEPALYQQSMTALRRIQEDLPDFFKAGRAIHFLNDDFLTTPYTDATVVLATATCFSQSMLERIGQQIEKTPSIRLVLSLRPIPTLYRLPFTRTVRVECSWDAALCYVYEKQS